MDIKTIVNTDKLFSKFDIDNIVCYTVGENENKRYAFSCKSNNELVYLYSKDLKTVANFNEFGIRNWKVFHQVVDLYNPENDNVDMFISNDTYGYPSFFEFDVSGLKIKHYVQNYNFISNQPDLLSLYKQRKFELLRDPDSVTFELHRDFLRTLGRMASMLGESFFRVGYMNDRVCAYIGDVNQTIDTAVLPIEGLDINEVWRNDTYFSIDEFGTLFRAMNNNEGFTKIKFTPNQIIMCDKTEEYINVGVLRGKIM